MTTATTPPARLSLTAAERQRILAAYDSSPRGDARRGALLTTVVEDLGGKLLPQIQSVFPDQQPIHRTTMNSWADPRVVEWVRQTGRKKVVIAGL